MCARSLGKPHSGDSQGCYATYLPPQTHSVPWTGARWESTPKEKWLGAQQHEDVAVFPLQFPWEAKP